MSVLDDVRQRAHSDGKSLAEEIIEGEGNLDDALSVLSPVEAERLLNEWRFWSRPKQQMPALEQDWSYWLILAGRGFGKTRTGAETIRSLVASGKFGRIALVGQDPGDVRDVMIEGPAGILAVSPAGERPKYEPSKRRLTWPNGAIASVFSGENPDALRGPQHDLAWIDELCAFSRVDDTWANLKLGLRLRGRDGTSPRAIITTTPRPLDVLKEIIRDPATVLTQGSTYENRSNLDPRFFSTIVKAYEGTRRGRQELDAEIIDEVEGAMWTLKMLDDARVSNVPTLERIVVAIDPAATSTTKSDETGIIVAGLGDDGCVYIIDDISGVMRPRGWAARAVEAYEVRKADCIVAEDNNGGEMVEETVLTVDPNVNVRRVHASKGKRARAEPVAALYEKGLVKHVGRFEKLEKQMTSYVGLAGDKSPDRLDALVWAVHELMLSGGDVGFV